MPNNSQKGVPTTGLTTNLSSTTSLSTILSSSGVLGSQTFALGNQPHRSVRDRKGKQLNEHNSIANRRVIYGSVNAAGTVTYISTDADATSANGNLHYVITLAGHKVHAINNLYFDGVLVPLTYDSGTATWNVTDSTNPYYQLVQLEIDLGDPTETSQPFPRLHATVAQWDNTCLQRGCAKVHLRLTWDDKVFSNGVPSSITFDIEGKEVYDPRLSPPATVFSNNAALCIRDWLTDTTFGMGVDPSTIDDVAVAAAANICDDAIPLREGGTQARYTVDGIIDSNTAENSVLASLVTSMAGIVVPPGDMWRMYAGAYRDPILTITDADLRDTIKIDTMVSRKDTANAIKGTYVSPANKWQASDFPPFKNADFVTADGGDVIWTDLTLDFITDPVRAQRVAKINLEKKRRRTPLTLPCKMTAFQAEPGDTIQFTHAAWGFSSKTFIVTNTSLVLDSKNTDVALGYDLVCMPADTDIFFWDPDVDEGTVLAVDLPDLPDSKDVGAPSGLTLESDDSTTIIRADGIAHSQILVSWTAPTDAHVLRGGYIEVFVKKVSDPDSAYYLDGEAHGSDTQYFIAKNIVDGTDYDVKIRSVNSVGAHSASVIGSVVCGGTASAISGGLPSFDFETTTSLPPQGWELVGTPTLAYDTTTQMQGVRSLKISTSTQSEGIRSTAKWQVIPGDFFTGERWKIGGGMKAISGVGHAGVAFVFFDKTDTEISRVTADGGNPTSASWAAFTNTGLVPHNAVYARIYLQNLTTTGTSVNLEFDSIEIFRVASLEDEVADGPSRGAITAANTSYRPMSNPLTAHDDGSSTEIDIASFTMRVANGNDVSINSGTITGLGYNLTYHVYYDDPTYAGGTVTFFANTDQAVALDATGRFYVGSIQTPTIGGVDTVGNNDGGTGAQSGGLYWLSPTLRADVDLETGSVLWSPAFAEDTDGDTGGTPVTLTQTDVVYLGGIPTIYTKWKSLKLKVRSEVVNVDDGCGAFMDYSLDDGNTWNNIFNIATGSQDQENAGSAAQTGTGTAWTNPANLADPNFYATITGMAHGASSQADQATAFGFSVPAGSTIDGITINFDEQCGGTGFAAGEVPQYQVQLLKAGTPVGDVKTVTGQDTATLQLGDDGDLWGTTWADTDINNANFGFQVTAVTPTAAGSWQAGTYYSPLAIILKTISGTSYVFQVATAGTTGSSEPSWNTTLSHTTPDGPDTLVWVCLQAGTSWASSHDIGTGGWRGVGNTNNINDNAGSWVDNPNDIGQLIVANAGGTNCVFELTPGRMPRLGDPAGGGNPLLAYVWTGVSTGGQFSHRYPSTSGNVVTPPSLHWTNSNNSAIRAYTGGTTSHMLFWPLNGNGTLGTAIDSSYGIDVDFAIVGAMWFPKAGTYHFNLQTDDGRGIGFDSKVSKVSGTVVAHSGSGTINPGTLTAIKGFPFIAGQNAEGDFGNFFSVYVPTDGVVSQFEIDYRAKDGYNYLSLTCQDTISGNYYDIIPFGTDLKTGTSTPTWPAWTTAREPLWPTVTESVGNLIWINRGPATDFAWAASAVFTTAATEIQDVNGFGQKAYRAGISNVSAAPIFATNVNGLTTDGSTLTWRNDGTRSVITTFDFSIRNAVAQVNFTPPTATNSRALTTDSVSLSLTQNLGKVQLRYGLISLGADTLPNPPVPAGELDVFECWVEAQAG